MTEISHRLRTVFAAALFCMALALAVAPERVAAQQELEAIELPQGNSHAQEFDKMQVLLVDDSPLDLEVAMSRKGEFSSINARWIDFGGRDGGVWLRMSVVNTGESAGEWMIDIQRPFVEELIVAKRSSGGPAQILLNADAKTPASQRLVASPYWVAPLWIEAGEEAEIWVGMSSPRDSWMPLTLATPERMRTAHMQEARFNWLINGGVFALIIAAIAMARLVGWQLSVSFAAYASAAMLFVANNEGYLHQFLWPERPQWFGPLNALLLPLIAAASLEFARRFVDLAKSHPAHSQWLIRFEVALLGLSAIAGFSWQKSLVQNVSYGAIALAALVYVALGFFAWRGRILGGVPFLIGAALLGLTLAFMAAVLAMPGQLPLTVALDYFHGTLLLESFAFFIAIVVRMLAMQRRLNRSLSAEVEATQAKLKLEEDLRESRSRYDAARDKADLMRSRLASTSHDLQQPLLSLRQRLRELAGKDSAPDRDLVAALDYLESVTESGLADAADHTQASEQPVEGTESFPISIVLNNCAAMFRAEAEAQGVALQFEASEAMVQTDPVALMRALSNLISNALKHAEASTIAVSAADQDGALAVKVTDDGKGIDEATLSRIVEPYVKGESSGGHGLGLSLVREFASQPLQDWAITSAPDKGSAFSLTIPLAD